MSDEKSTANDLVHPQNAGFVERVTPKKPTADVFFFECATCKGSHFRHAGYAEIMLPFLKPGGEKRVEMVSEPVKICVKCKAAYVWVAGQMYDVTDKIDLAAWEKTEKEAHAATGPGGQC
ncbi:MAG: hypothetical protein ACJ741_11125 [Pyrinomonadaceae bacterium]